MDVLSDVLGSLKLRGAVYCRSSLARPWQLRFEAHDAAVFHYQERGEALLETPDQPPLLLREGDLVLLTNGEAHTVSDPHRTDGARVPRIHMPQNITCLNETWCEGTPDAVLLCGTFHLEPSQRHALRTFLTARVHIPARPWLETIARLMTLEVSLGQPGLETVVERLADVLFVQIVRHCLETTPQPKGWIAGLRDPKIARSLERIHAAPHHPWTVAALAEEAALSRSLYAQRFSHLVGTPPLEYLTRWRMRLATRLLRETRDSLPQIAERSGYNSEVSFHRAFKRITGRTPGEVRREARQTLKPAPRAPLAPDVSTAPTPPATHESSAA